MGRVAVVKSSASWSRFVAKMLMEAGRRNSGSDHGRINTALANLFDLLNEDDQKIVLKALSAKVGASLRYAKKES